MDIDITNQQETWPINDRAVEPYARWIMEQVQKLAPEYHWSELSLVLTDDSIQALNREWFQKDSVTDVISFAYPDQDGFEEGDTGEVIVNVEQAWHEGQLRESPDLELALYIAHGCHHLMGADDDTPEKKQAMLEQEHVWVETAAGLGLVDGLFGPRP